MKPIKNQASSIAGLLPLSAEAKLCFGAAGGCAIIGIAGSAVNTLTTSETTLSAFRVFSVFYLMLGVIGLFKRHLVMLKLAPVDSRPPVACAEDELIESAALLRYDCPPFCQEYLP